ncbi:MAG: branched-chain amino acid ABC transporter permease [Thermoproteota archaeon]
MIMLRRSILECEKLGGIKILKDRQVQVVIIFFLALAAIPLMAFRESYILWILIFTQFYAMLAISWNLLLGYTQLISFAHTGLLAMGGYFSVFFIRYTELSPIIGLLVSTVIVTFVGFLIGWACLRLRGIYLALTTWSFSGAVQLILMSEYGITGGLTGLSTKFLLPQSSFVAPQYYYYVVLILFMTCTAVTYKLISSKYGLYLRAIGDDEEAAAACGVNIVKLRIIVFTISSTWVGVSGAFYAHLVGYVSPALADFSIMITIIAATILGGLGTFFGPILGAFIMWPLSEVIRAYSAGLQMILASLLIILFLKFFRNGFLGALSSLYSRTHHESSVNARSSLNAKD